MQEVGFVHNKHHPSPSSSEDCAQKALPCGLNGHHDSLLNTHSSVISNAATQPLERWWAIIKVTFKLPKQI
jgi:hypothetical protein